MPRKSDFHHFGKINQKLALAPCGLGHSSPQRCPSENNAHTSRDPLGSPLSIRAAAKLIGCSPWTVRQKLIPQGLPHFRSGASGRLIFYTHQVVRWIESQQGGNA